MSRKNQTRMTDRRSDKLLLFYRTLEVKFMDKTYFKIFPKYFFRYRTFKVRLPDIRLSLKTKKIIWLSNKCLTSVFSVTFINLQR